METVTALKEGPTSATIWNTTAECLQVSVNVIFLTNVRFFDKYILFLIQALQVSLKLRS